MYCTYVHHGSSRVSSRYLTCIHSICIRIEDRLRTVIPLCPVPAREKLTCQSSFFSKPRPSNSSSYHSLQLPPSRRVASHRYRYQVTIFDQESEWDALMEGVVRRSITWQRRREAVRCNLYRSILCRVHSWRGNVGMWDYREGHDAILPQILVVARGRGGRLRLWDGGMGSVWYVHVCYAWLMGDRGMGWD